MISTLVETVGVFFDVAVIVAVPTPNPVTVALVPVPNAPEPVTRRTFVSLEVQMMFSSVVSSGVNIAVRVVVSSFEIENASVLSNASPVASTTCLITLIVATPLEVPDVAVKVTVPSWLSFAVTVAAEESTLARVSLSIV